LGCEGEERDRVDGLLALRARVFALLRTDLEDVLPGHTDVQVVEGEDEVLLASLLAFLHQHHLGAEVHEDASLLTDFLRLGVGTDNAEIEVATIELCDLGHVCSLKENVISRKTHHNGNKSDF